MDFLFLNLILPENNISPAKSAAMDDITRTNESDIAISIENVWKIFGTRANEALAAIKASNLSKAEVLEEFNPIH